MNFNQFNSNQQNTDPVVYFIAMAWIAGLFYVIYKACVWGDAHPFIGSSWSMGIAVFLYVFLSNLPGAIMREKARKEEEEQRRREAFDRRYPPDRDKWDDWD